MNDFSQGSVKKSILAQAIPLTLAQIVQLLYNIVDRIYIGHLPDIGEVALTGVGVTFPIMVLIAAFTSLLGTGGTPLFSIARGNKNEKEAEAILGNAFLLLCIGAIILFTITYCFRKPILFLFGASEISYEYANQYLQIYLWGTAFSMLTTGLNGFINAQGFPKTGMATTLIGAIINIVLDPICIFVLDMGVKGAAMATVISQAISVIWVVYFLTKGKAICKIRLKYVRIEFKRAKRIIALGIAGFVAQGSNALVQIVCNRTLQIYGGDLYVGVMTIVNSAREILSLPISGISGGSQPVLGYNYGAKKYERVKEGIRFTAIVGCIYTVLAWIGIMLVPQYIVRIFTADSMTIIKGAEALNIYFFGFFFMSFQFAGQSTFQALGKAKQAIFFSLFRKVIIVVPMTLLLPALGLGVNGVFWAEPISNVIGGLACFVVMWQTLYKKL